MQSVIGCFPELDGVIEGFKDNICIRECLPLDIKPSKSPVLAITWLLYTYVSGNELVN